jgi:hypothetical protein
VSREAREVVWPARASGLPAKLIPCLALGCALLCCVQPQDNDVVWTVAVLSSPGGEAADGAAAAAGAGKQPAGAKRRTGSRSSSSSSKAGA